MPELPDVEIFRRDVAEDAVGEVIVDVSVGIPRMVKFISPSKLIDRLTNNKITATKRHGKNLFLKLKDGSFVRMHFGMTGNLEYENDGDSLPKHTCLALHFTSGMRLVFTDPRRFGAVSFIDKFEDFLNQTHIGPDIETLNLKQFEEILTSHRGQIKPILMDQSLMSGLGNVYTDEVLFQAKIHPETHIDKLNVKSIALIFKQMKYVIKEAIKDHAERSRMPSKFLIHNRHEEDPCPRCKKGKIVMKTIGGRSTYYCNRCQT